MQNTILNILRSHSRSEHEISILEDYFDATYSYMAQLRSKMDSQSYMKLIGQLKYEQHPALSTIFEAGDIGRKIYFIIKGEVGILVPLSQNPEIIDYYGTSFDDIVQNRYQNFKLVVTLKQGSYFGEVALQNRVLRTATVLAKTDLQVAILTYEVYQKIIRIAQSAIIHQKITYLQKSPLFESWDDSALQLLMRYMEEKEYPPFSYIFKHNSPLDYIYFVISGEVKYSAFKYVQEQMLLAKKVKHIISVTQLSEGQHFGDFELYDNPELIDKKIDMKTMSSYVRTSDAYTQSHCKIYRLCLYQFIVNFHLFSNVEIAKTQFKKLQCHRTSMQKLRNKIITTPIFVRVMRGSQEHMQQKTLFVSKKQLPQPELPRRLKVRAGQHTQTIIDISSTNSYRSHFFSAERLKQNFGYIANKQDDQDITQIQCKTIKPMFSQISIHRRRIMTQK